MLRFIFKHFLNFQMLKCFRYSYIGRFPFLEALKDSKIPYLFLTDLVSSEFYPSQKIPCYLIFCN